VLLVGTTDMDRRFHPFGIGVTSNEATEDFLFLFNSLKASFARLHDGNEYKPKVIVADCAEAITNAAEIAFGEFLRVHCWAHVIWNADKELGKIKDACLRQNIREDIEKLQLAKSEEEFSVATALWVKKWGTVQHAKAFVEGFHSEYIVKSCGWYEGLARNSPSTNNSLEATNKVIKDECTIRERLPIRDFFTSISKQLHTWSTLVNPANPNAKIYSTRPTLSLKIQTDSFNWSRTKVDVKVRNKNGRTLYYIQPNGKPKLRECDLILHEKQSKIKSWRSFDKYAAAQTRIWKMEMEGEDWESATCTCPSYWKNYICKHILGIAIRLNIFSVIPAAKNVPLGQKRKRGRPAKAKKALLKQ